MGSKNERERPYFKSLYYMQALFSLSKFKIYFPFFQILIHGLQCNLSLTLIVSFQKQFSTGHFADFHIRFYLAICLFDNEFSEVCFQTIKAIEK